MKGEQVEPLYFKIPGDMLGDVEVSDVEVSGKGGTYVEINDGEDVAAISREALGLLLDRFNLETCDRYGIPREPVVSEADRLLDAIEAHPLGLEVYAPRGGRRWVGCNGQEFGGADLREALRAALFPVASPIEDKP